MSKIDLHPQFDKTKDNKALSRLMWMTCFAFIAIMLLGYGLGLLTSCYILNLKH